LIDMKKRTKKRIVEGKAKLASFPAEFFREMGRRGGKIGGSAGGKVSAAHLTPQQRREQAKAAVAARWKDKK
jgi:hypothetical protein